MTEAENEMLAKMGAEILAVAVQELAACKLRTVGLYGLALEAAREREIYWKHIIRDLA